MPFVASKIMGANVKRCIFDSSLKIGFSNLDDAFQVRNPTIATPPVTMANSVRFLFMSLMFCSYAALLSL